MKKKIIIATLLVATAGIYTLIPAYAELPPNNPEEFIKEIALPPVTDAGIISLTDTSFKIGNGKEVTLGELESTDEEERFIIQGGESLKGKGELWSVVDQIDIDFIVTSTDNPFATDYSGFYVKAYADFGGDERITSDVLAYGSETEESPVYSEKDIVVSSQPYDPSIEGFAFGGKYRITFYPAAIMERLGESFTGNGGVTGFGIVFGDWKQGERTYALQILNASVYGDEETISKYADIAGGNYVPETQGEKDGEVTSEEQTHYTETRYYDDEGEGFGDSSESEYTDGTSEITESSTTEPFGITKDIDEELAPENPETTSFWLATIESTSPFTTAITMSEDNVTKEIEKEADTSPSPSSPSQTPQNNNAADNNPLNPVTGVKTTTVGTVFTAIILAVAGALKRRKA